MFGTASSSQPPSPRIAASSIDSPTKTKIVTRFTGVTNVSSVPKPTTAAMTTAAVVADSRAPVSRAAPTVMIGNTVSAAARSHHPMPSTAMAKVITPVPITARLAGRSVKTVRRERGGRRRLTSRLADEQVRELVAAFEAGATRMELDERYGIGQTSVAKLLRAGREKQTQEDVE